MIEQLFLWPPILWGARFLLFFATWAAAILILLFGAVFLQPKNIKALLRNGLPAFSGFGASAEIFGQVLEVNATLDTKRDEQLDIINSRVDELERVLAGIAIPEATGEG